MCASSNSGDNATQVQGHNVFDVSGTIHVYNIIGSKGVPRSKEVSVSSVLSRDVQLNCGRYVYAYTCLSLSRFIAHALNIPTA